MIRFRPSVVVEGSVAWEEDGWRRLRIGAALFRVVRGCDRRTITMTDPDTLTASPVIDGEASLASCGGEDDPAPYQRIGHYMRMRRLTCETTRLGVVSCW